MNAFDELKKLVVDVEEDMVKAEAGVAAAGTRARKGMQAIKAKAQEIRENLLKTRALKDIDNQANKLVGGGTEEEN